MNNTQRTYSNIIYALLNIPEVNWNEGNFSYGLSNYIAKFSLAKDHYQISDAAQNLFIQLYNQIPNNLVRSAKVRNGFTYDHVVPVKLLKEYLLTNVIQYQDIQFIQNTLQVFDKIVIITNEENERLTDCGLRQKLPAYFNVSHIIEREISHYIRYEHANITISNTNILMTGPVIR
jgi:hypothetical protein